MSDQAPLTAETVDLPLRAEVIDGAIVIRVGASTVAWAGSIQTFGMAKLQRLMVHTSRSLTLLPSRAKWRWRWRTNARTAAAS